MYIQYYREIFRFYIENAVWYLTFLSLLIFSVLVLARFITDRLGKAREKRKIEIRKILIMHINNPLSDLKKILFKKKDIGILAEILPAILHNLKGSSREKFISALDQVDFDKWIEKQLCDGGKKEKIRAITILKYWLPSEKIKNLLKELLQDRSYFIRYAAIDALSYHVDVEIFPLVVKIFEEKGNFSYPIMADVFHRMGSKITEDLAKLIKSKSTSLQVKIPALMAIAQSGDGEIIEEAALTAIASEHDDFRAFAFRSLAKSNQNIDLKIIEKGLRDKYWRVRLYTANCLANIRPMQVESLLKLLDDENAMVSLNAARVIFSFGDAGKRILEVMARGQTQLATRAKMMLMEKEVYGIS